MIVRWPRLSLLAISGLLAAAAVAGTRHDTGTDNGWKQHDIHRPKPPVVEPAKGPGVAPADAIVLFDGKNLDAWQSGSGGPAEWKVSDGAFVVTPGKGAIRTKAEFGDVQLHVEWASPSPAKGTGQDRGNSGLFLMGLYELQVIDSYKADTYADGQAGAIYGQYPPLFNASKPPGEWQTYDVAFRRPRFAEDGKLLEPARVTLIHNGILVQNNEEILGQTTWLKWTPYKKHADAGPIELQDHSHPVKFRNIWIRNLPERPAPPAEAIKKPTLAKLSDQALEKFTGPYVMGTNMSAPRIVITKGDGHLLVKFPFLPTPLVIEPINETTFAMPHTDGRYTFDVSDGKVTAAKFEIGDGERTMKKVDK